MLTYLVFESCKGIAQTSLDSVFNLSCSNPIDYNKQEIKGNKKSNNEKIPIGNGPLTKWSYENNLYQYREKSVWNNSMFILSPQDFLELTNKNNWGSYSKKYGQEQWNIKPHIEIENQLNYNYVQNCLSANHYVDIYFGQSAWSEFTIGFQVPNSILIVTPIMCLVQKKVTILSTQEIIQGIFIPSQGSFIYTNEDNEEEEEEQEEEGGGEEEDNGDDDDDDIDIDIDIDDKQQLEGLILNYNPSSFQVNLNEWFPNNIRIALSSFGQQLDKEEEEEDFDKNTHHKPSMIKKKIPDDGTSISHRDFTIDDNVYVIECYMNHKGIEDNSFQGKRHCYDSYLQISNIYQQPLSDLQKYWYPYGRKNIIQKKCMNDTNNIFLNQTFEIKQKTD